jgi:hypothetical protein
LGYVKNSEEQYISDTITHCIQKSLKLTNPSGGYIIKKVSELDKQTGILTIDDIDLKVNRIIASQLTKSTLIALFVGTISDEVEKLSESLFQDGDPLEGYIMNLAGSEAAESVAHFIHETIKAQMIENDLQITNRFSPGYCEWDVAEQFKLFNYFPPESCKVSLNPSALMQPIKSVSGIIGIGKEVSIKSYPCNKCTRENCIYKTSL